MNWQSKNYLVVLLVSAVAGLLVWMAIGTVDSPTVAKSILLTAGAVIVGIGLRVAGLEFPLFYYKHYPDEKSLARKVNDFLRSSKFAASMIIVPGILVIISSMHLKDQRAEPATIVEYVEIECPGIDCSRVTQEAAHLIRTALQRRIKTRHYIIQPYGGGELFPDLRSEAAAYYLIFIRDPTIDITDPTKKERLYFSEGKYTIGAFSQRFNDSIDAIVEEIVSPVSAIADYEIFVRGSADKKPFYGRFDPGYEFRHIVYHPLVGESGNRFKSQEVEVEIREPLVNKHLPLLRGAFMQRVLSSSGFGLRKPSILQGSVTDRDSPQDMNVTIILMVEWEA